MTNKCLSAAVLGLLLLGCGALPGRTVAAEVSDPLSKGWIHTPLGVSSGQSGNLPTLASSEPVVTGSGLLVLAGSPAPVTSESLWKSVDGVRWTQIPLNPSIFQSGVLATTLLAVGGHLIMIGSRSVYPHPNRILLWISDDGKTWRRSREDPLGPAEAPSSIASGGPGLIAVGRNHIWTSADGLTWHAVPDHGHIFAGAQIESVTRGGPGLVAVGEVDKDSVLGAAVWTSIDGRTWKRENLAASVAHLGGSATWMYQVIAGVNGLVVTGETGGHGAGALWASPDGIHWQVAQTAPFSDPVTYLRRDRIVAAGDGFAAIDWTDDESSLWFSRDGLTWTRLGGDDLFGGLAHVTGIVARGSGLLALGSFQPIPRLSCGSAPILRAQPTWVAYRWTPQQSETATAPKPIAGNPKGFRIRGRDLIPLYGIQAPYQLFGHGNLGYWLDLCGRLPALERHRAYSFSLQLQSGAGPTQVYIDGLGISTASAPVAHAAFSHMTPVLVFFAPWDPNGLSIVRSKKLGAVPRIGAETRLFKVMIKCGSSCMSHVQYTAYVVLWRSEATIGAIVVQNSYKNAIALARRQLEYVRGAA